MCKYMFKERQRNNADWDSYGMQEFAAGVLKPMEMLLSIAHEDRQKCIASQQQQAVSSHLEHLICSLQSQLIAWCQRCLSHDDKDDDRRHGDDDADDESHLIVQAVIVGCTYSTCMMMMSCDRKYIFTCTQKMTNSELILACGINLRLKING